MFFSYFMLVFFIIGFGYVLIFERVEKNKKGQYIFNTILCIGISLILLAITPSQNRLDRRREIKKCLINQKVILSTIEMYELDHKEKFPLNCSRNDYEKQIIDKLLKENYLKRRLDPPTKQCSYEIKDGDLYCIDHGSSNEKSPNFTNGLPIDKLDPIRIDYEKKLYEYKTDETIRYISIIVALIAALKSFIFIFLS